MKGLLRSLLFFSWMWIVLFLSVLLLIPLGFLRLIRWEKGSSVYVGRMSRAWAAHLVWTSGSKVSVTGMENVPETGGFLLVANHQSNFDIPLLMSRLPRTMGFVGKAEMGRIPFLSSWMKQLRCVFIDRKNVAHSMKGLMQACEQMEKGYPMALFPEGTRTRTGKPGTFHPAGIRLAQKRKIPVLPVTIRNSREMFEKQKRITPTRVEIVVHPLIQFGKNQSRPDEVEKIILESLL